MGGKKVGWGLVGASLFVPDYKWYPSLEEIEFNNKVTFKAHGFYGFSVGKYHEFFITFPYSSFRGEAKPAAFRLGGIEATFGQATPLAYYLFSGMFDEKYFGPWDSISSLRLMGVSSEDIEAAFINACDAYATKFGDLPVVFELHDDYDYEEEEQLSTDDLEPQKGPPIVNNLEPLRFFCGVLLQPDALSACIQFYRVLEYFSFFTNFNEIKKLRHDHTLSDAEFPGKLLQFLSKDEKGPLFKLIISLADKDFMSPAQAEGLIENNTPGTLCEKLYIFRNSIVHGKFSFGYSLKFSSAIEKSENFKKWRNLLRELARRAVQQYGSRTLCIGTPVLRFGISLDTISYPLVSVFPPA